MSARMKLCLQAATSLDDADLADLTDAIQSYVTAGVQTTQAETMAVADLLAQVASERAAAMALLEKQHPDVFTEADPDDLLSIELDDAMADLGEWIQQQTGTRKSIVPMDQDPKLMEILGRLFDTLVKMGVRTLKDAMAKLPATYRKTMKGIDAGARALAFDASLEKAGLPKETKAAAKKVPASQAPDENLGWLNFGPESGSLGILRANMPQIPIPLRSLFTDWLGTRGVAMTKETLPATAIKPTQAEYSRAKVDRWKTTGGVVDRVVLVSADGYILDGHHQWMAAKEGGVDIDALRIDLQIRELLQQAFKFPGATTSNKSAGTAPDERAIVNKIDLTASAEEKVQQLVALTEANTPLVKALIAEIDAKFGTESKDNRKGPKNILSKSVRPSILEAKPWYGVEHIRDSYRFKTALNRIDDLPAILELLLSKGLEMVKPDYAKLLSPLKWGWRFVGFDIRMPNGQIVEWYLPVRELEEVKHVNHLLFEKWRNRPAPSTPKEEAELQADEKESYTRYNDAWNAYLARTGDTETAVRAIVTKLATLSGSVMRENSSIASTENPRPKDQTPSTKKAEKSGPSVTTIRSLFGPMKADGSGPPGGDLSGMSTDKSIPSVSEASNKVNSQKGLLDDKASGHSDGGAPGTVPGAGKGATGAGGSPAVLQRPGAGDPGQRITGDGGDPVPGEVGQPPLSGDAGQDERNPDAGGTRRTGDNRVPERRLRGKAGGNWRAGPDDLTYFGSWLTKARANVEAIKLLKQLQAEKREATPAEQAVLAKYVGWGASELAQSIFTTKYVEQSWMELRRELKGLLTTEEWTEASGSTPFAHYTGKEVVRPMWRALERMGFQGGTAFEPGMGTGVFPGLAPASIAANLSYTGIELEPLAGGIAQKLFPDENITVGNFINAKIPREFYDIAIGNPPFANVVIRADREYRENRFMLHDYFFAKTLDRVRPGGLLMFVTSKGTMDKLDDKARAYMSERADLVGAVRLPQTAFQKNAGTQVVTDLIILRKKIEGETWGKAQPWGKTSEIKTPEGAKFLINEYFIAHPEMVLGTHSAQGSMYGPDQYTVLPKPGDMDMDMEARLDAALQMLPENVISPRKGSAAEAAKVRSLEFNPKETKEGSHYLNNKGQLMQVRAGVGTPVDIGKGGMSAPEAAVMVDYVPLRDLAKQALFDQLNDGEWETSQKALQKAYRAFVAKHGQLNQFTVYDQRVKVEDPETGQKVEATEERRRFTLRLKIEDDPEFSIVMALEKFDEDSGTIGDGAFLIKRVLNAPKTAEIRTAGDALLTVLSDLGEVNMPEIAARLGVTQDEAIAALGPAVYESPDGKWETVDEYLSGDVKSRLELAKIAAKTDQRFDRNVEALVEVQPPDIPTSEIKTQIGQNWLAPMIYAEYLKQLTGAQATIEYTGQTGQWTVNPAGRDKKSSNWLRAQSAEDFGVPGMTAPELLEDMLNSRTIAVYVTISVDGQPKRVLSPEATAAAMQKAGLIKDGFNAWLWSNPGRATELSRLYNDKFNRVVPRKFTGAHLTLPGITSLFSVHPHVKTGAWRIIQQGNTYLAHAVGAGKTFASVISAMERKRLGKIQKPLFIVPNHMLQQFAREWRELYPTAKLLIADEQQFTGNRRRQFVANAALSDLDGVIMTHSSFGKLDVDAKFKQQILERELEDFRDTLEAMTGDRATPKDLGKKGASRDPKIKKVEKAIDSMEQKLAELLDVEGKDTNILFSEMGVDSLYVDEAHGFRKLAFSTNRQTKGIDPTGSAAAFDLYVKSQWLETKNPGEGLVLMSGTPITNTLAELYTVQRLINPEALAAKKLSRFDDWAAMFGAEVSDIEPNAAGGYERVSRFAKFINVPELSQMFREYSDVLTGTELASLLPGNRPRLENGVRIHVVTPQTRETRRGKKELNARLVASREWKPSEGQPYNPDPVIAIIGDGRLLSLDHRLLNPQSPSNPDSKLNRAIDQLIAVYNETKDQEFTDKKTGEVEPIRGATQMLFADYGLGEQVAKNRGFSARNWVIKRLTEAGIPRDEIAFMSDYKKSMQKLKLFSAMNSGKMKIMIGSSKSMGTGVNAQQRLYALHHLDTPWYPADLEQREGRILRQGNKNPEVRVYAYATKASFDESMMRTVARKQRFIEQALSGDSSVRELDDVSEASNMEMAAAMVAGDQRAIQLAGLRSEVEKLSRLEQAHAGQQSRLKGSIGLGQHRIDATKRDLPAAEAAAKQVEDIVGDKFKAKIGATTYDKRRDAGQAIIDAYKALAKDFTVGRHVIGKVGGFSLEYTGHLYRDTDNKPISYAASVRLSDVPNTAAIMTGPDADPVGLTMQIGNRLEDVRRAPADVRAQIADLESRIKEAEARLGAPFEYADELTAKREEADLLELDMAMRPEVEDDSDDVSFSLKAAAPIFYSTLLRAVESKGPGTGTAEAWKSFIDSGSIKQAGVKPDEIEWSGVREWLDLQQGKVSKVDVIEYLRETVQSGVPLFSRNRHTPKTVPIQVKRSRLQKGVAEAGGAGLPVEAIENALLSIIEKWDVPVRVVATAADLPVPNAPARVEGANIPGLGLFLVASNLPSLARAREVLAHEAVGHYGFERVMGSELGTVLVEVARMERSDGRVRSAAEHVDATRPGLATRQRAKEIIAVLAERGIQNSLVLRALAAVRRFLRRLGLSIQYGLPELAADLKQAERSLQTGANGLQSDLSPSYSFDTDMEDQVEWLDAKATAAGFTDADDMAAKDIGALVKLAEEWRAINPAQLSVARAATRRRQWSGPVDEVMRRAGGELVGRYTGAAYDAVLEWTGGLIPEGLKARVVSDFGLTETYIDRRDDMQIAVNKQMRLAKDLVTRMGSLDRAQSRVAYLWMQEKPSTREEEALMANLPDASKQTLQEIKTMIDLLGQEAVRLGMLSQDAYDANKMAYLHRSYAMHEFAETAQKKSDRASALKIMGDQYKGRGLSFDLDPDLIESAPAGWFDGDMKGKKVAMLTKPSITGKTKREYAFVPAGATKSGFTGREVWRISDAKGGKFVLRRDFTPQERAKMGELDEVKFAVATTLMQAVRDIETGRFFEWTAKGYGRATTPAGARVLQAKDFGFAQSWTLGDWVQVPETSIPKTAGVRRYGALAGKYVPAEVWNDIRAVSEARFEPWGKVYASILLAWKLSKTALSPTVHMNNVMANFMMADLQDVNARHILKALQTMVSKDPAAVALREAFDDSGAELGQFVENELRRDTMEPLIEQLKAELATASTSLQAQVAAAGVMAALRAHRWGDAGRAVVSAAKTGKVGRAADIAAVPFKKLIDAYRVEDNIFRLAAFIKATDNGMTQREAGKFARNAFLDYRINAPWIQNMRATAFPFVAFVYRAIPLMGHAAAHRPWKLMKYMLLAGGLNALAYSMLGLDGDDEERERAMLPKEKSGEMFGILPKLLRMPWNYNDEAPVFLDVRRFIILGDIVDTGANNAALPIVPMMMPGGPLMLLAEVLLNRSGFTGRALTMDTDETGEKWAKSLDHVYKGMMPNLPIPTLGTVLPGQRGEFQTHSWKAIENAATGRTDPFGREQSTPMAIASAFGIKLGAYPRDVLIRNEKMRVDRETREIDSKIRGIAREQARNGITPERADREMLRQVEKKRRLLEEFGRKAGAAGP